MLDHHPKVAFNLESEFLSSQISEDGKFPEMATYRNWLTNDRVFRHSNFRINEKLEFCSLLNDFLEQKRVRDHKSIVGATVHLDFQRLRYVWPNARYIYIYRDPRDVANSVLQMGWAGNVYVAADHWLEAEAEWSKLKPYLTANNWIEVRYEELISNCVQELRRICEFLRVEYAESMFDYTKDSTYTAPDIRLNYQWKRKMAPIDIQRLECKLRDQIVKRGYALSDHPKIHLSYQTTKWLQLQSRISKFRFRLKRYGMLLTMQETLSRRLGLKELHQKYMRKMDSITDALLK
jgi:hypothetical protein